MNVKVLQMKINEKAANNQTKTIERERKMEKNSMQKRIR